MGRRRRTIAGGTAGDEVVIVANADRTHAEEVTRENGCLPTTDRRQVVFRDDLGAVILVSIHEERVLGGRKPDIFTSD